MPKKIDLINKRFGKLLVIDQADNIQTPNGRSHIAWQCICDCGNDAIVRSDNLRNGHTVSCGCVSATNRRQAGIDRKSNIEGQIFGYLTVLTDSNRRDTDGSIIWECQCECGNITYVSTSNLTRKKEPTISCGCKKSKGERKIIDILSNEGIRFIPQKRFDDCIYPKTNRQLIFDFYLPECNLLIEYDGEQHFHIVKDDRYGFEELKLRDEYKNNWCKLNEIPLVRIPYTDLNKIDVVYIKEIIGGLTND